MRGLTSSAPTSRGALVSIIVSSVLVVAMTPAVAAQQGDTGRDLNAACQGASWAKWQADGPVWEHSDGFSISPSIDSVVTDEDGEPVQVTWSATPPAPPVEAVFVKSSTNVSHDWGGGAGGTVTGDDGHAISAIIFCYGELSGPSTGSLVVEKIVVPAGYGGTDVQYPFSGTCDLRPQGGPVVHETFSLPDADDWSWTFEEGIPERFDGARCWLEETQAHGATITYWDGDTQLIPDPETGQVGFALDVAGGATHTITVRNTFTSQPEKATVTVTKRVIDPSGRWDGTPFGLTFTQTTEMAAPTTFTLGKDAERTFLDVDPAATMSLVETDARGADHTTMTLQVGTAAPIAYTAGASVPVDVTTYRFVVTNTFSAPTITVTPAASIRLVKTASPTLVSFDPDAAAPEVTYTYVATNTGATTLSQVTVTDDTLGLAVVLGTTTLAPDASTSGTLTYTIRAADVGTVVENDATATGRTGDGRTVTDTDDAFVDVVEVAPTVIGAAAISVEKVGDVTVAAFDPSSDDTQPITYTYTVTNTGQASLTVSLVDDVLGSISLDVTELGPGDVATGTAIHRITVDDVGLLTNVATATGVTADGRAVTATDAWTVEIAEVEGLILVPDELPRTGLGILPLLVLAVLSLATGIRLVRRWLRSPGA